MTADAYVCALGSYSPLLLKPVGIDLPVYPVKGYSITVPITDAAHAPESTVMDETHKVAVTRLGDRIRVGGTAELAGYSLELREARRTTLEHVVTDLFPRAATCARRVLVRPAADDARRHADRRADRYRKSLSRHRPRHARLDHGGRHRAANRRSGQRTPTRDLSGGSDDRSVRVRCVGTINDSDVPHWGDSPATEAARASSAIHSANWRCRRRPITASTPHARSKTFRSAACRSAR